MLIYLKTNQEASYVIYENGSAVMAVINESPYSLCVQLHKYLDVAPSHNLDGIVFHLIALVIQMSICR